MNEKLAMLQGGIQIGWRCMRRGIKGYKRYDGDVREICRAVVEDCWNGTYFRGSAGHFRQFWLRDLGMCTLALIRLGYGDKVKACLEWALSIFEKKGKVTTTIFHDKDPVDIYSYASDSIPFLIFALRVSEAGELLSRHKEFLNHQIAQYKEIIFDPKTGLVKKHDYLPGPKDCVKGISTMFSNTMAALLSDELRKIDCLDNPFQEYDFRSLLKEALWQGEYFKDDLSGRDIISSDANVWPFWLGIFDDREMMGKALATLQKEGLDRPFPIKYTSVRYPEMEKIYPRIFTPNYQGNTVWMQVGPAYIELIKKIDPEKADSYIKKYTEIIERDQNYLEIYTEDEVPYVGRFGGYRADEGMIWAAMFLDLLD